MRFSASGSAHERSDARARARSSACERPATSACTGPMATTCAKTLDVERAEELARDGADRGARRSLPGARALEDVAEIVTIELEAASEIRVTRSRAREWIGSLRERLGRHAIRPAREIAVLDRHADRRAERAAVANARGERHAIVLDLHAAASAVAALTARKIGVDVVRDERQTRDDPIHHRGDSRAVRFACRHPAKLGHAAAKGTP